jgi:hypothetical protein
MYGERCLRERDLDGFQRRSTAVVNCTPRMVCITVGLTAPSDFGGNA